MVAQRSPCRSKLWSCARARRDTGSALNQSAMLGDRPPTERPFLSMRDLIGRHLHPQPTSHIPPHDLSMRRTSEVYQSVQPPEVAGIMAVDAGVFRPDESSEVPFSSHNAALFASRATSSTLESTPQRRPTDIAPDRISESSYYLASRFEEDFAFSAPHRRASAGERRHRNPLEPQRSSTIRRLPVAEPPTSSAPAPPTLDIEEFQHGPFRATLERLERQGRQEQQMMMERQAEINRLRSRLDELQSQERSISSSRVPTLPPLRFDPELLVSEVPHRMPSPVPVETLSVRCSYIMLKTILILHSLTVPIRKQHIVGVAGREGEEPGLPGSTLAMSPRRGVVPRVSRRPLPPSLYLACIHHRIPFPKVAMSAHPLNANVSTAAGLVPWSCGALKTRKMQWTWQLLPCPCLMVVLSRVAWRVYVGNTRAWKGNNHIVSHAPTRHGAWILGVWR
ncbi:hypothetical protein BJV74DRAFT_605862 [Russula compacta]|nr:hypothetical protein BJV74DRAFT_605862 [Russula compacta]